MTESHAEFRQLMRSHHGLNCYEMLFAPGWLRAWRRFTVIVRRFVGLPDREW